MIRILFVSTSTTVGGAEKTLHTLATKIDPGRFKVVGIVSVKKAGAYADKLKKAGYPVYSLGVDSIPGPGALRQLSKIIGETKPDIVHALMYQALQLARSAKKFSGGTFKLISSPRVSYRSRSGVSMLVDRLLRSADDLMIAESEASRDYLAKIGYAPQKTAAIRNGIDPSQWNYSRAKRNELCIKLPMRHTDILVGTAGRLDEQKGHLYLIEAVAKLRVIHPVQCVIIGDGPMRRALEHHAKSLGVQDNVHLVGEQEDVAGWLGSFDIFALPSLWEGFPNALLEAMALGLPVVATKVDGVPEMVESGVTGLLCEPRDSQALFTAIQDLIVNQDLRKRLGAAARQFVSAHFQLANMIKSYEDAYARLSNGGRA